ncbi:SET family sugar efflux transporter-like MFS transporter [Friedmanniella endophytica]|uniref:SET family sugar efflux transporter-like MFS transporter n=1 Tax=Microlunatus kandeliicorticis TaxID=1759536 RepID=A0A7W3P6A4_9ACTN|nr:MFS transporter [Microlunatus kandeliicorticis]MBA8794774.1 SET family sugar efflux transporter-like MFS transporter [Microlunatus kandeliicorticis]
MRQTGRAPEADAVPDQGTDPGATAGVEVEETGASTLTERPEAAWRYLVRHAPLRWLFVAMLLSGFALSLSWPQMGLFLTQDLGLSVRVAGLYYVTNLAAPVAGFAVGALSDRLDSRIPLAVIGSLLAAIGWAVIALAQQPWVPFVINVLVLSLAGTAGGQLFTVARGYLEQHPTPSRYGVLALLRISQAVGWITGPALGAWLAAVTSLRATLLVTGALSAVALVPILFAGRHLPETPARLRRRDREQAPARPAPVPVPKGRFALLIMFTVVGVLMMSGESIKLSFLSIYMAETLKVSAFARGAVISLQPLLEIVFMALLAQLASRFGAMRIFALGIVTAAGAYLSYAGADSLTTIAIGQVFMSVTVAATGVLGVAIAQELCPERLATATNTFSSSLMVSGALGGLYAGVAGDSLGIPHLFVLPAAATGLAALVFVGVVIGRRRISGRVRT